MVDFTDLKRKPEKLNKWKRSTYDMMRMFIERRYKKNVKRKFEIIQKLIKLSSILEIYFFILSSLRTAKGKKKAL